MLAFALQQLEFIARVLLAGICGGMIGYERKNRMKEAGIRTHMIVALASALMMLVSKYGFFDIWHTQGIDVDPSRVAAQIVSGVGFLGAGMIFVRKQSVSGLTTAAGIWATAGVGMAIGSGMYIIGIFGAILIVIIQVCLHRNPGFIKIPMTEQITMQVRERPDVISFLQNWFKTEEIEVITIKTDNMGDGYLDVEIHAKLPKDYDVSRLMNLLKEDSQDIKSIEI